MTSTQVNPKNSKLPDNGIRPSDPHPTKPIVTELKRQPSQYIPPVWHLSIVDPNCPQEPNIRLKVELEKYSSYEPLSLDIVTNNDSTTFLIPAIQAHIKAARDGGEYYLYKVWSTDTPF